MAKKQAARVPLTRERALTTALAVADAEGLAAVTMRRLAQELGVEAMSLYHHVANKDDILDGIVDLVFAEIELPGKDVPWRRAMVKRARSVRAALTRHPWAISIMESRSSPGPATLHHLDSLLGMCRRAGFSVPMTAHAVSVVESYVYGFVLQEVNLPFDGTSDMTAMVDAILSQMSADDHPYLFELTKEHVLKPGYAYAKEFEFGLGLILDGLEAAAGG